MRDVTARSHRAKAGGRARKDEAGWTSGPRGYAAPRDIGSTRPAVTRRSDAMSGAAGRSGPHRQAAVGGQHPSPVRAASSPGTPESDGQQPPRPAGRSPQQTPAFADMNAPQIASKAINVARGRRRAGVMSSAPKGSGRSSSLDHLRAPANPINPYFGRDRDFVRRNLAARADSHRRPDANFEAVMDF